MNEKSQNNYRTILRHYGGMLAKLVALVLNKIFKIPIW